MHGGAIVDAVLVNGAVKPCCVVLCLVLLSRAFSSLEPRRSGN